MKTITKLWMLIAILAALSPIGLVAPIYFGAGKAWGEWGPEELRGMIGCIPAGLARLSSLWRAPIPDYAPLPNGVVSYIISAIVGILVITGIVYLAGKYLAGKR